MVSATKLFEFSDRIGQDITITTNVRTEDSYGRLSGLTPTTQTTKAFIDYEPQFSKTARGSGIEFKGDAVVYLRHTIDLDLNKENIITDSAGEKFIIVGKRRTINQEDGNPVYNVYELKLAENI